MKTNILTLAITLTVGIILAGSLLMPVLSDATETEGTVTNDGYYRMVEFQTTDAFDAKWDHTNPYVFTVNGTDYAIPNTAGTYAYTILGSSEIMTRWLIEGSNKYVQTWINGSDLYQARSAYNEDMEISVTGGVITFDNGSGTTKSTTLTESFYCVGDGAYVMKKYNEAATVKTDSKLVALGISKLNTTGSDIGEFFMVEGTIADGFTADYVPYEVTVGDITATYEASDNAKFIGLQDFSSLSFVATYDSTDTTVTYSQMLVPYEVTAELSQHLAPGEIAIMNALPVLIIVALVLTAVGALYLKRDD